MAAKKISELGAATTPLVGDELVELVQGGANVQATAQDIADLGGGGGGGGDVEEAPEDGGLYGRKDAGWELVPPIDIEGASGLSGWELVSTWNYSTNVAAIPFNNLGDYDDICVIGRNVTWSTSVQRIIQVSADNGSTYDGTAANYPISPEDGAPAVPGLGGFFPQTGNASAARGFMVIICNFAKATQKFQPFSSRGAYRFYTQAVALNALRVIGVASNAQSGQATGGSVEVWGRKTIAAAAGPLPQINKKTSNATLQEFDGGNIVELEHASAITLTVPAESTFNFPVGTNISVVRTGAGTATIQAASGVSLNGVAAGSAAITDRWAGISLYKRDSNQWVIQGAHGGVS